MLSVLYNLLEILVVLVPILLIEGTVIGSMQRWVGPSENGYNALLQPFVFILKALTIVFSVFTIFSILSFDTSLIFCDNEVTVSVKNEAIITHNKNTWNAFGAMSLYSLYKGWQAKTAVGKIASTSVLLGMTIVASSTMHKAIHPDPNQTESLLSTINGFFTKSLKSGNSGDNTVFGGNTPSNIDSSHPIHSPFEHNSTIIDWLFSLLPDSIKTGLRNRVPTSSFEELDAIDVLHFKYNLVVILLVVSVFIIAYCYIMVTVLVYLKNNREKITSKSTLLGKMIPSNNLVFTLVTVLQCCGVLNAITALVGLHFLFTQPFVFMFLNTPFSFE